LLARLQLTTTAALTIRRRVTRIAEATAVHRHDVGRDETKLSSAALAMRDEQRRNAAVVQSRSDVLTGIIGARRAWTVSMISALSMPCR
jgi:hypothetical protein